MQPRPVDNPSSTLFRGEKTFLAALILLGYGLLYPGLFLGTETFCYRDYPAFSFPLLAFTRDALLHGHLPQWNPYNLMGIPHLAQWSTLTFYPGMLLLLPFPLSYGLPLFGVLHLAFAGLGMRYLVRYLTQSAFAGFFTGILYGFGGLSLSMVIWPHVCAAYGLAPWVVATVLRACEDRRASSLAIAALTGACQILTGHEFMLFTWAIVVAAGLVKFRGRVVLPLLVAGVWAITLAAVQLLPFTGMLLHSNRLGDVSQDWSLHPANLFNFLLPYLNTTAGAYGLRYPQGQAWLSSYYVPLTATLVMFWFRPVRSRAWTLVAAALFATGCILAMAPHLPWISNLLMYTPLGIIRYPIKYVFLAVFALILLIGEALASWETSEEPAMVWALGGILGIAVLLVVGLTASAATTLNTLVRILCLIAVLDILTGCIKRPRFRLILAASAVLLFDGATHMPRYPLIPVEIFEQRENEKDMAGTGLSLPTLGGGRLQRMEVVRLTGDPVRDHLARAAVLSRDRNLPLRVPSVGGFYAMYLKNERRLTDRLYFQENYTNANSGVLDFLGVNLLRTPKGRWIQRTNAMPLVSVGQAPLFSSTSDEVDRVLAADLRREAVVTEPIGEVVAGDPHARVLDVSIEPEHLSIRAETTTNTLLVISQCYYPAWKATVNARPVRLVRVNVAFQGVILGPGASQIELQYRDDKLWTGAWVSAGGLLLALCTIALGRCSKCSVIR